MSEDGQEVERRGFVVRGRVQGVGFRWWTQRTGASLGLGGHVRNKADGTVEVHAAGPPERLDELERALRHGPSMAKVQGVDRIDADPRTPSDDFLLEEW